MNLRQGQTKSIEIYAAKFRKLLTCLNARAIPATFQIRIFLNRLKKEFSLLVAIRNPTDLNGAVNKTKMVEVGQYYILGNNSNAQKEELKNNVEKLTRQFE
jgi:hypothetical protein